MRESADPDKVILAVAKAAESTLDRGRWMELGYRTGTSDVVLNHPRLLRSLDWGDPDYSSRVLEVVRVLGQRRRDPDWPTVPDAFRPEFANLDIVEEFLKLPKWLREHQPQLYRDLYAGEEDQTVIDELQAAAAALGLDDVDEHAARIRGRPARGSGAGDRGGEGVA